MREVTQADLDCIQTQLGRTPRDVHAIAYRCPCGKPAVVETPLRTSQDYAAAREEAAGETLG